MADNPIIRVDEEVKKELDRKKESVEKELGLKDPSYNDVLRIKLFGKDYEEKRRNYEGSFFNL